MKTTIKENLAKSFLLTLSFLLLQTLVWAQGGGSGSSIPDKVDIDINTGNAWYSNPVVWIVGGAVFILLLVALTRGGSRSSAGSTDRVTVTKTVERDTDV